MKVTCVSLLLAAFIALACSDAPDPPESARKYDSAGIAVAVNSRVDQGEACLLTEKPDVLIGVEQGDPAYMLSRVFGATVLSDGRIVLAHDGTGDLRYYDASGKHLMTAGRQGNGPGEFRNPFFLFALPGDTVWVGDYRPWRFVVFSPDGKWVRNVSQKPEYLNSPDAFGVMQNGKQVLAEGKMFRQREGFSADSVEVRIFSPSGDTIKTLGKYPNGRWGTIKGGRPNFFTYPIFESFTQIAVGQREFAISSSTEAEVQILNDEGRVVRILRWETPDRKVQPGDLDAFRRRVEQRAARMDSADRAEHLLYELSPSRPVADYFPAVAELLFGKDDKLWVRQARRPADSLAPAWLGFNSNGDFACQLRPPAGFSVYEFGADYLLGLAEDSLGVERIAKYGLRHQRQSP